MFTPSQAIEAIKARISGVWDNPQLDKLGPLTEIFPDIDRIIALTDEMPTYHLFTVSHIPATNTQPVKVCITSERYGTKVILSGDNAKNPIDYLTTKGYNIIGEAEGHLNKKCIKPNYLLSDTFVPFKK